MKQAKKIEWDKLIEFALTVEGSMGNTYNRFYDYSFMNQILLMWQGCFEPVATYRRWADLDRQVKKGSKAKEIVMPRMITLTDEECRAKKLPKGSKQIIGFFPKNCIFSLSETEGADLPEIDFPNWTLEQAEQGLKVERVKFDQLNGNIQGYSFERKYAINPVADHSEKTTMHELAHIVLGHTSDTQKKDYADHRGIKEFQAEVTAFLVMKELGQLSEKDNSESRAYIQHWLKGEKPDEKAIRGVFSAVNKILKAGKGA